MPNTVNHTPGPWSVGRLYYGRDQGNRSIPVRYATVEGPAHTDRFGTRQTLIARLQDVAADHAADGEIMDYGPSAVAIADAYLMAAAPDLLAACRLAEQYFAGVVERAVGSGCDAPAHVVEPLRQLRAAIALATNDFAESTGAASRQYICAECGGTRVLAAAVPCHVCAGTGRSEHGPESHRLPVDAASASAGGPA